MIDPSIQRVLVAMLAELLLLPADMMAISDDDIEAAVLPLPGPYKNAMAKAQAALGELLKNEVERRVGLFVDHLRNADGIDPDQIDQVLGVMEEDL